MVFHQSLWRVGEDTPLATGASTAVSAHTGVPRGYCIRTRAECTTLCPRSNMLARDPTAAELCLYYSDIFCFDFLDSLNLSAGGYLGPGNGYGEWALTTRESGLYRFHCVHMARKTCDVAGYTGRYR